MSFSNSFWTCVTCMSKEINGKKRGKKDTLKERERKRNMDVECERKSKAAKGRENCLMYSFLHFLLSTAFPQISLFVYLFKQNKTENQNQAENQTFQSLLYVKCKWTLCINSTCMGKCGYGYGYLYLLCVCACCVYFVL